MTLSTWPEIKKYLRLSRYKIILLGYPVYTLPKTATVYADTDALDQHTKRLLEQAKKIGKQQSNA